MNVLIKGLMWGIFDIWSFIQTMLWPVTVVIAVVIICRLVVKRISKQACYFLWVIVAIRLVCPVTIGSELSIFNLVEKPNFMTTVENVEKIGSLKNNETGVEEWNSITNAKPSESSQTVASKEELGGTSIPSDNSVNGDISYNQIQNTTEISDNVKCGIWLTGVFLMLLYGVISYRRLKHKLRFATKNEEGYFESEHIASPFVLGILKPVIYLPCHLNEEEKNYILLHERYHITRKDYLVKIVAFGLLCMYWFHPFVWLAFYLMSQDMETSCDEQVLKNLSVVERKAYSTILLSFAARKRFPLPAPLSFGENNVKSRIKQILNYKKPTIKAMVFVVGLMIVVAVICLTDNSDGASKDSNRHDMTAIDSENKIDPETGRLSEAYLSQLSEKLYEAKNPYIGDAFGNGKMINYLKEALDITGTNGMELQTSEEPYWLTLGFDKKPNDEKMFQLATMFLTLVDNASEFRWEFPKEDSDDICVYYVNEKIVNLLLSDFLQTECKIKDYAKSPEDIAKLWRLLEEVSALYKSEDRLCELARESDWEYFAQAFGFDFTEANKWENRFIKDGLIYNESDNAFLSLRDKAFFGIREITSCIYKDFDENGQKDMAVLITGYFGKEYGSRLFFYMDDAKQYTYAGGLMNRCFGMDIQTGDIDHDGNLEFAFIGMSTGNGGAGSYCKDLFQYEDGRFWNMTMPGDYNDDNKLYYPSGKEMGYDLEVYWGKEMDTYDIYCPELNVKKTVYSPYSRDKNGGLYNTPKPGELVGGNCRGFHTLEITEIDGKDYLVGTEVLIGDGGTVNCFADARFVLAWDMEKEWVIKDFSVIPYDYGEDEETILEIMQESLQYRPTDYNAIIAEQIPMIDYKKDEVIEAYDAFSYFARCCYEDYERNFTYVIWNANGEPIYVKILLKDGIYYYLEDYSNLTYQPYETSDYRFTTYTNEIYTVQKTKEGEYVEYFYLTNEENLTLEEIQESLLSSTTATRYDMMPVYHKKLDEDGFSKYMETTGDILDLDIQIQLPADSHWIQQPNYSVSKENDYEKPLAKVTYYDGKIFSDMTLLVGAREDVFDNTDITSYIDRFTPESLVATTLGNQDISIDFYVIPIDDVYKMAVALWEHEENTYVLYGKTAAGDCSWVTKVAAYIIGYFE